MTPRVLICSESLLLEPLARSYIVSLGKIVWAHEDVKQLLGGISEVVVRGIFIFIKWSDIETGSEVRRLSRSEELLGSVWTWRKV